MPEGAGQQNGNGQQPRSKLTVERIAVKASLDPESGALERARAEANTGDESWVQWVSQYERGEALIVRLDVRLEANDGQPRTLEISNRGIFIEASEHPPKIQRQISELVSKDFSILADELSKVSHPFDRNELCDMYVDIELAEDLRAALIRSQSTPGAVLRRVPHADIRLSKAERPET